MRRFRLLTLALTVAAAAATASTALAAKDPPESYAALQKQVKAHQVLRATIARNRHSARVRLANGKKYAVNFPGSEEATLVASLRATGAKVHVDKVKATGLRLRYIALIALAVIALIAGIAYLVTRRRRPAAGLGEPASSTPAGQG